MINLGSRLAIVKFREGNKLQTIKVEPVSFERRTFTSDSAEPVNLYVNFSGSADPVTILTVKPTKTKEAQVIRLGQGISYTIRLVLCVTPKFIYTKCRDFFIYNNTEFDFVCFACIFNGFNISEI